MARSDSCAGVSVLYGSSDVGALKPPEYEHIMLTPYVGSDVSGVTLGACLLLLLGDDALEDGGVDEPVLPSFGDDSLPVRSDLQLIS